VTALETRLGGEKSWGLTGGKQWENFLTQFFFNRPREQQTEGSKNSVGDKNNALAARSDGIGRKEEKKCSKRLCRIPLPIKGSVKTTGL